MTNPVSSNSSSPASYSDGDHLQKTAPKHIRTVGKVKEHFLKHKPPALDKLPATTPDLGALMASMDVFENFSLDSGPAPNPEPRKRSKTEPEEELGKSSILNFLKDKK